LVPLESLSTLSYPHLITTTVLSLAASTQYTKVTDTHLRTKRIGTYGASILMPTALWP